MKKFVCVILVLMVLCATITSCGPSTAEVNTIQKQLIGTWVDDSSSSLHYWYVFTPDWNFCEISSLPDGSGGHEINRGTYKIGAKYIKLNGELKSELPYDFNKNTSILMSVARLTKVSETYDLY